MIEKTKVELILMHMDATGELFKQYHAENGAYRIAKALKKHNEEIIHALDSIKHLLPKNHAKHAEALIYHLNEWRNRWLAHEEKKAWEDSERFAFENPHTYPRESSQDLDNYFRHLLT